MPTAKSAVLMALTLSIALSGSRLVAQDSTVTAPPSSDPVDLAVLPILEADRAAATVLTHDGSATLREGSGAFICLADNPSDEGFKVACYHRSLGPYMARGRALRAEGISGKSNIEKRWEEIEAGTLDMPRHPASLQQLFGADGYAVTTATEDLGRLTVIYMAYADVYDTGLPGQPAGGQPWLMYPGKPTAHVMISGK